MELIVVVAIMAVLLGILVPTLVRNVELSKISKDKKGLDEVRNAIEIALAKEEFSEVELSVSSLSVTDGVLSISGANTELTDEFIKEVNMNLGNLDSDGNGLTVINIIMTSKLSKQTYGLEIVNQHCTVRNDGTGKYAVELPESA